eukprot:2550612-Pyramimonas_sp.AAC.1
MAPSARLLPRLPPSQAVVASAASQAAEANAPGQAVAACATTPVTTEDGSRKSSDKSRSMEEIEMRAMFEITNSGGESDTSNLLKEMRE